MQLWKCGHPRTPENSSGKIHPRCRTCRRANERERKHEIRDGKRTWNDASCYTRSKLGEPLSGEGEMRKAAAAMDGGNRVYLKALWKHHPRIMYCLEAQGLTVWHP